MKLKLLFLTCLISLGMYAQEFTGSSEDLEQIINNAKLFSEAVIKSDYEAIANYYTDDAKIFPNNRNILAGTDAIKSYWTLPEGVTVLHHSTESFEIKVIGEEAYDYGIYEGKTKNKKGDIVAFKGKYVIVWKKVNGVWKMYLDMWNSIKG